MFTDKRISFFPTTVQKELFRKSIHLTIAIIPTLAKWNLVTTMVLLAGGTLFYSASEFMRLRYKKKNFLTAVTELASRKRDEGKFVMGPITLALGTMLCLLLYPEPAAAIGIYALAFGDGLSSVVGKVFGRTRIPFTGGKTVEGSMACFTAVYFTTYQVSGKITESFILALIATSIEALPLKDLDNIFIPALTGLAASILLL